MNKIISFFISPPVYIAVSRKRGGFLSGGILFLRHVDLIVFALRLASAKKFLSGFCTCTILFRSSAFFSISQLLWNSLGGWFCVFLYSPKCSFWWLSREKNCIISKNKSFCFVSILSPKLGLMFFRTKLGFKEYVFSCLSYLLEIFIGIQSEKWHNHDSVCLS